MFPRAKPIVVLRPVPEGYSVAVEPPLSDGEDWTRTFADKSGAWAFAQGLWTDLKLGFRDETIGNVSKPRRPRGPYRKRRF
jgi:hypothetical protein